MSNTPHRAIGEGGECLQVRSKEEESVRERGKKTAGADTGNPQVPSSCLSFCPEDKMEEFQKHSQISKTFSESCPWIAEERAM